MVFTIMRHCQSHAQRLPLANWYLLQVWLSAGLAFHRHRLPSVFHRHCPPQAQPSTGIAFYGHCLPQACLLQALSLADTAFHRHGLPQAQT
eukprot:11509337-Karenia_brevis.AAC.1